MRRGFTLVELIIVITILAILSVSAFLVVSQWIGKSRDSRRLSDLGTIQRALEVSLTENSKYPTPDTPVNITAGSVILGQQGKFGDSATAATDIKTTPKDPLDNVAYSYYVATGGESYQVMGFLENSSTLTFRGIESQGPRSTVSDQENLQFSNSACTCNSNGTNSICSVAFFASLAFCLNYAHASEVSAADYSVRIPTVKGEILGILILSGTNQPVEELGSTIDLNTTTSNLIAVFSNTDKSSGTGGQIISSISINNKTIRENPLLSSIDSSLLLYFDMETLTSTGALKDLSKNNYVGECYNGATLVVCGSATGPQFSVLDGSKAFTFDGVDDYIRTPNIDDVILKSGHTIFAKIKSTKTGGDQVIVAKHAPVYMYMHSSRRLFNGVYLTGWNWHDSSMNNLIPLIETTFVASKWSTQSKTLSQFVNQSKKSLFVDWTGTLTSTGPGRIFIGADDYAYNRNYFGGQIDSVRIYARELSDTEIMALMN